jgi:hypothetical protein
MFELRVSLSSAVPPDHAQRHGEEIELDRSRMVRGDLVAVVQRCRRQARQRRVAAEHVERAHGDVRLVAARDPSIVQRPDEGDDRRDEQDPEERRAERALGAVQVAEPARRRGPAVTLPARHARQCT